MVIKKSDYYFKVLKLSSQKWSTHKIANILGIPQSTVFTWVIGKQKPYEISEKRQLADENNRKKLKDALNILCG